MIEVSFMDELSLCKRCHCMTKSIRYKDTGGVRFCGKCKLAKGELEHEQEKV